MAASYNKSKRITLVSSYSLRAYLGQTYTDDQGNEVPIPPAEWDAFVKVIAETFPNGFTIYDAVGGYAYDGQTFIEPTKVLEVVVPKAGSCKEIRKFARLVDLFTIRFNQQSQFWTLSKVRTHSA